MIKGKLIVIEGSDGAGKATQVQLLKEYLTSKNISNSLFDFPRYDSFIGQVIKKYQFGEFGPLENYSPYLVSIAYAADRGLAAKEIQKELDEGKLVIANRYAYSNMAHQSARLPDAKKEQFLKWDQELEFEVNKLPKEDLVIFLYVPFENAQKLMSGKSKDLAEEDLEHMRESERMYLDFSKRFPNWVKVDCVQNTQMRDKENIAHEIVSILKEKKVL